MKKRDKKDIEWEDYDLYDIEDEDESALDFKSIIDLFRINWKIFALSMLACLGLGVLFLIVKSPEYQVNTKMLIKEDGKKMTGLSGIISGNALLSSMTDLGMISSSIGVDNEIEILQSNMLLRETIMDLKLYTEYRMDAFIRPKFIYKKQPITVDIDKSSLKNMDEIKQPIKLTISKDGNGYKISGKTWTKKKEKMPFEAYVTKLPATVKTYAGTLTLSHNIEALEPLTEEKDEHVIITPVVTTIKAFLKKLNVETTTKNTTILALSINDKDVKRAEDFISQLVICYNRQANADKNELAMKTEDFVNERLAKIVDELGTTEDNLENYKKSNNLGDIKLDATATYELSGEYATRQADVNTQIELMKYLRQYVDDPRNNYQLIPSNIGLGDKSSTELIASYNENVLMRNKLLRTASESSPQVQTLTSTLDELQRSIHIALAQAAKSAEIRKQNIDKQHSLYQSKINKAPAQERALTEISRQTAVKSELYLMLLSKREENSISLASTADKGKLVDEMVDKGKVSPKASVVLAVAFILGIGFPFGILYLKQMMRSKVEARKQVESLTTKPVVADIPLKNTTTPVEDAIRALRANILLNTKPGEKVIHITSDAQGEGKTFCAANLATSIALLGKKVIVVDTDIRKPSLATQLGIGESHQGLSSVLAMHKINETDVKSIILTSKNNDTLDILPAGDVPTNPAELIACGKIDDVVEILKNIYDYIIIDSTSLNNDADAIYINKVADYTLYVVRADVTTKKNVEAIDQLAENGRLKNINVAVNAIDLSQKKYKYQYGK
ncbi:MAG: GumC family protein [Prevotella sp.]